MGVKIHDKNNIPRLLKQTEKLDGRKIRVGVMETGDMGMIAAVHEFGARIRVTDKMRKWFAAQGYPLKTSTKEIVIPERSFIRAGFDSAEREYVKNVKIMLGDALEVGVNIESMLEALALDLRGRLQEFLTDMDEPKLSDMTIEMTERDNPLIHSTRLRKSITFEVK